MDSNRDISIIHWQPLPAPADRIVLIRYRENLGTDEEYPVCVGKVFNDTFQTLLEKENLLVGWLLCL